MDRLSLKSTHKLPQKQGMLSSKLVTRFFDKLPPKVSFKLLLGLLMALLTVANPLQAQESGAAELKAPPTKPELVATTPITAGAVLKEYFWETDNGPAKIFVTEIDLNNPYIELAAIPGRGKLTERLNVTAMARNTGAVAAINGDFYNMQGEGVPIGPMATGGQLVSSPSKLVGWHSLGITADRKAYIETFAFDGKVVAPNGTEFTLSGLNKAPYFEQPEGDHSHAHKLHLYNDLWGGKTRGQDSYTTPTELLIGKGKVVDISEGKYFDFQVPDGMSILRGHGEAAKFLLNNFKIGDSIEVQYALTPDQDWGMILGGYSLLVDQGKAVSIPKQVLASMDGLRARTGAGISEDGKTVYLIGVEGRTEASKGLNLSNLTKFFEELGAWKAINLDGGGSTTMAARPLGEWQANRVFAPEQANERLVVNALGVYSTAPQGELQGLIISGNEVLLVGEEAAYTLKAFDQYFNPLDPQALPVKWSKKEGVGDLKENLFLAKSSGAAEITAAVNNVKAGFALEVAGKTSVNKLNLAINTGQVAPGKEIPLNLTLTTFAGRSRQVPADLVDWQFYNLKGSVSAQGLLTVSEAGPGGKGAVVARYQGYSAPLFITVAEEKKVLVFEEHQNLTFLAHPQEVKGELKLVSNPGESNPQQVTALKYDFRGVAGTTAAYIKLGETGITVDPGAYGLALDVYGDNGNQWLRAELKDGNGTIHRVDLTDKVNWTGWKTVHLNLDKSAFNSPLQLMRVYVVANEDQQEEKATQGTLLFKNMRFWLEQELIPVTTIPPISMELVVDQKQMVVNGVATEMDVAPVIVSGRTLVPVRFVSQALQSNVIWDGETRNVTVIQGDTWIDLWIGENLMVVDGQAVSLDVPPEIINGRSMLPLRALAEMLDLSVGWDPETRGITLKK